MADETSAATTASDEVVIRDIHSIKAVYARNIDASGNDLGTLLEGGNDEQTFNVMKDGKAVPVETVKSGRAETHVSYKDNTF